MNKQLALLGSLAVTVCTALAQTPPAPGTPDRAAPLADAAATTRHGRVQGVMATPDGTISGLFLGGRTAVSLFPELSRQLSSLPIRGREVTVSGASRTIDGLVTVQAQTIRVGGSTFVAAPSPMGGAAPPPPPGRSGEPREVARSGGRPAPGFRPNAPPPPPGVGAPPPPPVGRMAPPPPPPANVGGRDPGAVPPPPPPPPPSAGSVPSNPPRTPAPDAMARPPVAVPAPPAAPLDGMPSIDGQAPTPPKQ